MNAIDTMAIIDTPPPPAVTTTTTTTATATGTKIIQNDNHLTLQKEGLHPAVAFGLAAAFVAHGAILLSLPPVLRQRGAPFLPTASKGLDTMFQELKKQPVIIAGMKSNKKLYFFDLGSGDGRVVFRAAREGLFFKSIGFEINPVLHAWAKSRRTFQCNKYWSTTDFLLCDLWNVDLSNADVVAVYGLHPIMGKLGKKMEKELKHGCIVVSNVFTIPQWVPVAGSHNGIHIYSIPHSIKKELRCANGGL